MINVEFKLDGAKVKRETEKALLLSVELESPLSSLAGDRSDVWFPKSQITVTEDNKILCTGWILEAKEREVGRIEATRI